MKAKPYVLILPLLLSCLSQLCEAQTTQEEYNYITKGLKLQKEAGLEPRKDYGQQYLGTYSDMCGTKAIAFGFYRLLKLEGKTYVRKGIMIRTFYDSTVRYNLIPVPGTPAILVEQCQRDLGIHKDADFASGSNYPDYLLCLARALTYLTTQLQKE
jgi:hypothetical protein